MSDTEVIEFHDTETVSFLPGDASTSDKEALYSPSPGRGAASYVCGKTKAIFIIVLMIVFIVAVALIAAFAKSACPPSVDTQPSSTPPQVPSTSSSSAIPVNKDNFPWKNIRLPKSILPDSYYLQMTTDLDKFIFGGTVHITLNKITEEVDFIVLHSKQLNITGAMIKSNEVQDTIIVNKIMEYSKNEQLYLSLSKNLKKTRVYILSIDFVGSLDDKLTGFYRSSYKDSEGNIRYLATTQFEPTDARAAFPCFDEPSLKANFSLSMTHHKDYTSLFNMPQRGQSEPATDNMVTDHYETSVKMSSYLVAFVVCNYDKISDSSHKYKVSVYTPKQQIKLADWALEVATKVLPYYEDFYGQPYPLPKQDLVAIPDFQSGAMENWGLILYRMADLLYDPAVATEASKERVAVVVAHELAHQWFGNLVTMTWWNDLWLNEGFASYVEVKGVDFVKPGWGVDYMYVEKAQKALKLDSLIHSHPISVDIQNPDQINSMFDYISYEKGSSLINMMASFLGESVLKSGLKAYLDKYKYGNAITSDLWDALSEANHKVGGALDINNIMESWTTQMGYPLITVSRHGDTVSATQERFYLRSYKKPTNDELVKLKLQSPNPGGYSWSVPLTYISQNNKTNQLLWMPKEGTTPTTFQVEGDWFKVNINQSMFYRVNYDDATWRALIKQIQTNHTVLTSGCRSNLIDDAFALAMCGILDSDVVLNMTRYLTSEIDYMPWSSANIGFQTAISIVTDNQQFTKLYKRYIVKLMKPVVEKLGHGNDGTHLTRLLRSSLFKTGVQVNESSTVSYALELFKRWMNNNESIPLHLKAAVLDAGIIYGGEAEWNYCWNRLLVTTDPSDLTVLRSALAETTDASLLQRYLSFSLQHDKIKVQDASTVIIYVAQNPIGRQLAWTFTKEHWTDLYDMFHGGPFVLDVLIKAVISQLTSDELYSEVKQFFETHQLSHFKSVQQGLEYIQIHTNWKSKQVPIIQSWLEKELAE